MEGSLFVALYVNIGGGAVNRQIHLDALLRAFDIYLKIRQEASLPATNPRKQLTINEGWVLARELRSRQAMLN